MNVQQPPSEQRRGAVLLFSLAIIALLSLFALTFVKLVGFERKASANYTDAVRARMLARAGIRRAVVELQDIAGLRHYSDPRSDGWIYQPTWPAGLTVANRTDLDLKLNLMVTATPSFKMQNLGPLKTSSDPEKNKCNATAPNYTHSGDECETDPVFFRAPLAVSGFLGSSYEGGADVYKLKILDSASQVNLNHPDRASAQRMLKNLLRSVADDFSPAWALDDAQADAIAAHVMLNRPSGGFRSKGQIQDLVTIDPDKHLATCPCATLTPDDGGLNLAGIDGTNMVTLDRWEQGLRDLLTVHSWIDEKVIRPWNLNPDLPTTHAYYQPARRGLPLMRRAPINLNTASKAVLVALFAGLESRNDYGTFRMGYTNARVLAQDIIDWRQMSGAETIVPGQPAVERGPFKSWLDFETWLDHRANVTTPAILTPGRTGAFIPGGTGDGNYQAVKTPAAWPEGLVPDDIYQSVSPTWKALELAQGIRDTIKAQLNPNTMLNKFGQGANHGGRRQYGMPIPRLVDKSDLSSMSTEGCFDSMGVFEITSLGMVLQRDAALAQSLAEVLGGGPDVDEMGVIAAQTQQVVIRVYDVVRYTTQDDFERFRAMMAPGDFIPDKKAWATLKGVNRESEAIMTSSGWPSLITQPVYSISRDDLGFHNISSSYTPADYDGHMTLTNLLGVDAQPWDFISGFARGTTQAFKCRVWWDPKDQNPFDETTFSIAPGWPYTAEPSLPAHSGLPSHPRGAFPPNDVPETEIENWYNGDYVPASGLSYSANELVGLCTPLAGAAPLEEGKESEVPTPLDAKPGMTEVDGDWWHEGSSLWNNGVATGPRRVDGSDNPIVVAYSGNNINLERASSIRVWVQPLADPYLREDEVLMSFVGSNGNERDAAGNPTNAGGIKREVGFRVVKRAIPSGVNIVLQACPSDNDNNDVYPSGHPNAGRPRSNPRAIDVDTWGWFYKDDIKWEDVVELRVTPDVLSRFGTTPAFKALNPLEPEWLQNSWHWLVVNYGYARDESGELEFAQFDMSLQVDMLPTQPPRGSSVIEGVQRIAMRGDTALDGATDAYGELHGHELFPDQDLDSQPLGNFTGTLEAEVITLPTRGTDSRNIHVWLEPRVLGDYYNCRAGNFQVQQRNPPIEYLDAVTWDADLGSFTTEQPINFPPSSFDHRVMLRWPDGEEKPMFWNPSGENAVSGNWSFVFTGGMTLPGPDMTMGTPDDIVTEGDFGDDGVPGTADDSPLDIVMYFAEMVPTTTQANDPCRAVETSPGVWDGAAMQHYHNQLASGPPEPGNGDNSCRAETFIHGRPPVLCDRDGDVSPQPCWTVTNKPMVGPGATINAVGYGSASSEIPADFICDGCRGCENCDVDAPLFIGGEPRRGTNLTGPAVSPIDPDTVAYAVFDNLVIKNKREFEARTDYTSHSEFMSDPDNPGFLIPVEGEAGTPNAAVDWYEDRFFETTTATQHLVENEVDPDHGYGATYRRGLLELIGARTRVGSMSWTTYPTSDGRMQYEIGLQTMSGKTPGGEDTWRGANETILGQVSYVKDVDEQDARSQVVTGGAVTGYKDGLQFGSETYYDGLGDDTKPYDILMLKVQLGKLYRVDNPSELTGKQKFGFNTSSDEVDVLPSTAAGLPTPITESPVFEDVTINLLRETPQYLYAEEGVNE